MTMRFISALVDIHSPRTINGGLNLRTALVLLKPRGKKGANNAAGAKDMNQFNEVGSAQVPNPRRSHRNF